MERYYVTLTKVKDYSFCIHDWVTSAWTKTFICGLEVCCSVEKNAINMSKQWSIWSEAYSDKKNSNTRAYQSEMHRAKNTENCWDPINKAWARYGGLRAVWKRTGRWKKELFWFSVQLLPAWRVCYAVELMPLAPHNSFQGNSAEQCKWSKITPLSLRVLMVKFVAL